MIHRSRQTCQVGFNVSSTLQEHSISVLTKCRARLWIQVVPRKHFRPGQTSPGRFLLYLYIRVKKSFVLALICHIKPATPHSAESAQRHSAPCIGQHTAQKFICFVCICRSRVFLVPGNLRCSEKSHCLSAASLRFFWTLLADFQTLRYTRLRNRTQNK